MSTRISCVYLLLTALVVVSGCGTGPLKDEKRNGKYLVITDLDAVELADVSNKGVPPKLHQIDNRDWGIDPIAGRSIEQVVDARVQGKALYVDDKVLAGRLSSAKILIMRKLDADDVEFIRKKYASENFDYLILVTKSRLGMSDLYGAGMQQNDVPLADFRCQFFASMQLEVFELASGNILSTLTELQRENCPVDKYFDDVNHVDDTALAEIRDNVTRVAERTANRIARHLLMTDAEKDEFKMRLPGFE